MPAQNASGVKHNDVYYHIYNRGVDKRTIFKEPQDYSVFLGYLNDYLTTPINPEKIKEEFTVNGQVFRGIPHQPKNYFGKIELIAYSLKPNHFHLVLHPIINDSLEKLTRSLFTRYSIYFNKKYKRRGSLFEGPYKSKKIENIFYLCLLTHYLHRENGYTSLPEYLGTKETVWVKSKVVKSYLNSKNWSYHDFMEKYKPDQKTKKLLAKIIIENQTDNFSPPLERKKIPPKVITKPKPKPRIPEFLIIFVVFIVLFGLGIRNIQSSSANNGISNPIPTPKTSNVLSKSTYKETEKPSPTPEMSIFSLNPVNNDEAKSPSPEPKPSKISPNSATNETVKSNLIAVVKTDDATSVNIRQKPDINSAIIGKAMKDDLYKFVSVDSGWYEIKLANNSTGFIWAIYVDLRQSDNL